MKMQTPFLSGWLALFRMTLEHVKGRTLKPTDATSPRSPLRLPVEILVRVYQTPQLPRANDVREVWAQQFSTFEDQNFSSIILEFLQNARDLDVPGRSQH